MNIVQSLNELLLLKHFFVVLWLFPKYLIEKKRLTYTEHLDRKKLGHLITKAQNIYDVPTQCVVHVGTHVGTWSNSHRCNWEE